MTPFAFILQDKTRRAMRALTVCALTLVLSACATAPREAAVDLAETGEAATLSISSSLMSISNSVSLSEQMDAFIRTYDLCVNENTECVVRLPEESEQMLGLERKKYNEYVAARLNALGSLRQLYTAMREDAQTDDRVEMEAAASGLIDNATGFAGVVGLPADLISNTAAGLATQLAGLYAENKQAKRLQHVNKIIEDAAALMADALQKEADVHNAIARNQYEIENEVRSSLVHAGVAEPPDYLTPFARLVDVPLVKNSKKIAARNENLKTALDAVVAVQKRNAKKDRPSPYDAGVQALSAMSKLHRDFENLSGSDLGRLMFLVQELERAALTINAGG